MEFHKNLVKSALLKVTRLLEHKTIYYLARGNDYHPLVNPLMGVRTSQVGGMTDPEAWAYGGDKVQHGMTQLMSLEIYQQNIGGAVAELGAYRGYNASVLNHFFPDRKLYLFDTFTGFDKRDLDVEVKLGYDISEYHDFSDTNVDILMAKMAHKENVIIRKGWFPDSVAGLENETFCFVTLDPDLYWPTYQGLHWFYPRLANGGYIVIDDFYWDEYPGAKKAVRDFAREAGVSYVPMLNATGGVVIGKPLAVTK